MQGYALGDGYVNGKENSFRVFVYDLIFASKIRRMLRKIKVAIKIWFSEYTAVDKHTSTPEWTFVIGGAFAVKNLNLGLLKSREGLFFLAGLWDADGGWSHPDGSHPLGQARLYGGWHTIYVVKHGMRHRWSIATGRISITTPEGHKSRIGDHFIITRTNVYGTGVKSKSMNKWIELIGRKMLLKRRPGL